MSTETERTTDLGFARPRSVADDDDRPFRESLEDLSRQLAARGPHEPPTFDPAADVELPREPTKPAGQNRRRGPLLPLLALVLGVALAAVVHAMISPPPEPQQPPRAAVVTAPPLPSPVPPPSAAEIAPIKPVTIDPPAPPVAPPVVVAAPEPVTPKGKLEGYEIMEIQTRLKALGLTPGPLDGAAGSQTVAAIKQYEASKGRPQTGKLDRELLKQLRQEPQEQAPAK